MHSKTNRSQYMTAVLAVRRARIVNLVLCAVGAAAAAAAALYFYRTAYRFSALCLAAAFCILFAALIVRNAREMRAVMRIASAGVYAAKLTPVQQRAVRRALVREGRSFSFTAFLVLTTIEGIVLVTMYIALGSDVFLLFLAGFALLGFGAAVLSPLYLAARLSEKPGFCTLSENGALFAGEVVPFSVKKGDPLELLRFTDYYLLRLRREAVFGITYRTRLLIPADGALKTGLTGTADAALARTLGLAGVRTFGVPYYESRDYAAKADDQKGAPAPEKEALA
ncbi:MAG: hypothetical protein VB021_08660 [Oscillospiraceae bacterium]|nr:hypothetical protein [Oscillospiraceae bacterium]